MTKKAVDFVWNGNRYTIEDPEKDQIIKYGIFVPYVQSENPEEKVVIDEYILWSARLRSPIVIPRWFLTDLASIPQGFRTIVSKSGETEIPSLPHDFGYALNGRKEHLNVQPIVTRKEWDLVLKDFCKQQNMGWLLRELVYSAVRAGGWWAFKSKGELFIPKAHREFYVKQWPLLKLNVDDGQFIIL